MTISTVVMLATALVSASGGPVARVDGTPISRSDLTRRLDAPGEERQLRGRGAPAALEALIVETLLASEGRRMGLAQSREVAEGVQKQVRQAASDALAGQLAASVEVKDDDLRTLFHATADFVSFDSLVFETREAALASKQRIDRGGAFALEAKHAVVANLSPSQKEARPLMRGQIEAPIAEALFGAEPGQSVGPLKLKTGWVVARLIRKEVGTEKAFAARRESLEGYARDQATASAKKHLVAQLKARATISIDEGFLAKLDRVSATAAQLDHTVATVNGRPIPYRDIYPAVRSLAGATGHMGGAGVKIQLTWREVEARLLQDAAIAKGLDSAPEALARKPEFERRALASAAAAAIQAAAPAPTDQEITTFYQKNSARYARPFEQVLPIVAADSAEAKRLQFLEQRIAALRKRAVIEIDEDALDAASRR